MEISGHLIEAEVPHLKDSIDPFRTRHLSLKLQEKIEARNLELSSGSMDIFFNAIPDSSDLAGAVGMPEKELLPHLAVEAYNKRIAHVLLEKGRGRVSRRTNGYVSTRPMVTEILLERAGRLLQQEFHSRYRESREVDDILAVVRSQSRILESTALGRLFSLMMALREVRMMVIQAGLYTNRKYFEVIEKRTWKLLELKARDFAVPSDGGTVPLAEEGDAGRAEGSGKQEGARGIVASRRASDSDQWRSYESTVAPSSGAKGIDWPQTFRILGSFFTTRILLRKNMFDEILKWIEGTHPLDDPELGRILTDCETAQKSLQERNGDREALGRLNEIVQKLREMVYRY